MALGHVMEQRNKSHQNALGQDLYLSYTIKHYSPFQVGGDFSHGRGLDDGGDDGRGDDRDGLAGARAERLRRRAQDAAAPADVSRKRVAKALEFQQLFKKFTIKEYRLQQEGGHCREIITEVL